MKPNIILDLSTEFALSIINYCEVLESHRKFVLANQLLKSGTSIGANIHEAQIPESQKDFVHKLKIAFKEAEETSFWLILCEKSESYPKPVGLSDKLTTIKKILNSIIRTTLSKINNTNSTH